MKSRFPYTLTLGSHIEWFPHQLFRLSARRSSNTAPVFAHGDFCDDKRGKENQRQDRTSTSIKTYLLFDLCKSVEFPSSTSASTGDTLSTSGCWKGTNGYQNAQRKFAVALTSITALHAKPITTNTKSTQYLCFIFVSGKRKHTSKA